MGRRRGKRASGHMPVTHVPLAVALERAQAFPQGIDEPTDGGEVSCVTLVKAQPTSATGKKSRKTGTHARFISTYHALVKEKHRASGAGDLTAAAAAAEKLQKLGGIETYQRASVRGEKAGGYSSKWLVPKLEKPPQGERLVLLDVGALHPNYEKHKSWIDADSIDLNSQHPAVQECDFFDFNPAERLANSSRPYDCVCLSLVLNFVGAPKQRGQMLQKACRLLKPNGKLFVVLPRACVENSRYTTTDSIKSIAEALGLERVDLHITAKLVYMLFTLVNPTAYKAPNKDRFKRLVLRPGEKRNNFVIQI